MTDTVQIAVIAAVPPTLVAVGSLFASLWNGKKINELHVIVNSRLSELLDTTSTASEARGVLKEHARRKLEDIHFAEGVQAQREKGEPK